jgi:hypothetical protein
MDLEVLKNIPSWEWPSEANKTIRQVLGDKNAETSDRLIAAELAGELPAMNDELAEMLLAIAMSPEESTELRGQSVMSLGPALEYADTMEFDDPEEDPISEETFGKIRRSLQKLYGDVSLPKLLLHRVLEAAVRAPEEWHEKAVRAAYHSNDAEWRLTAVFCMNYVQGFDREILEALQHKDPQIQYLAVCAAGAWGIDGAWKHVAKLVRDKKTEKSLRLVAIEAAPAIRPEESIDLLSKLTTSKDEDIAAAAFEALSMAEGASQLEEWDED